MDNLLDKLPYGSLKYLDASKEFLSSNNLVAQIVIFILIIIFFVVTLRLGVILISSLLSPSTNPYLINGLIDAKKMYQIPQDPKINGAIPILRSNNEENGIEFTYSVWINIDDPIYEQYKYKHVFHKGSPKLNNDGIAGPNNSPGLYISPVNYPNMAQLSLLVRMNVFPDQKIADNLTQLNQTCLDVINAQQNAPNINPATPKETIEMCQKAYAKLNKATDDAFAPTIYDDIEIAGIPVNKWVSVIIKCSDNNVVDVYINGRLTKRHKLTGVVRQNYDDLFVGLNGGFSGNTSDLRYYNRAIESLEISNIVNAGPSLKALNGSNSLNANPPYLSSRWFSGQS